jgi:hypothetical protein
MPLETQGRKWKETKTRKKSHKNNTFQRLIQGINMENIFTPENQ